MATLKSVTGMNTILRNMGKAKKTFAAGVGRGLMMGGLHLQRKSQDITPVDFGPLKASAFTRNVGGKGFATDIIVGYGSEAVDYAVYVHEDLNKVHGKVFNIKYAKQIAAGTMHNRGENQQAKFLERPAREERRTIIIIVRREAGL